MLRMLRKRAFWENFIILVILLSIAEILLEDISIIGNWKVNIRKQLLMMGFIFDLIFTIEFIIRSVLSKRNKRWGFYWKHENGWVDFLSSIPLILFNSGPIVLGMLFPGRIIFLPFPGLLNILKISNIMRAARMLRLLRILKIFNKPGVEKTELKDGRLGRISSIIIVTVVFILITVPLIPGLFYSPEVNIDRQKEKYVSIMQEWYNNLSEMDADEIQKLTFLLKRDKNVLFMYYMGDILINNAGKEGTTPDKIMPEEFIYTDFKVIDYIDFKLWYSVKDVLMDNARINLLIEVIIIALLTAFTLFYKPAAG